MVTFKFYSRSLESEFSVCVGQDFERRCCTLIHSICECLSEVLPCMILKPDDSVDCLYVILDTTQDLVSSFASVFYELAKMNGFLDPISEVD